MSQAQGVTQDGIHPGQSSLLSPFRKWNLSNLPGIEGTRKTLFGKLPRLYPNRFLLTVEFGTMQGGITRFNRTQSSAIDGRDISYKHAVRVPYKAHTVLILLDAF
jgi:hypothetical protein